LEELSEFEHGGELMVIEVGHDGIHSQLDGFLALWPREVDLHLHAEVEWLHHEDLLYTFHINLFVEGLVLRLVRLLTLLLELETLMVSVGVHVHQNTQLLHFEYKVSIS
jgi:hypothetical protein